MSMHKDDAIVFKNVNKTYKLYQNQWQMIRDVFGYKLKHPVQEYFALKNINLTVKRGERLGVIGRNGAGKSTALKLITGNFIPTSGEILINGKVQALMNTGLGFHPEFTGMDNIKASLLYNGLKPKDFNKAILEIVDFVELGEFIDQPLKTYSLGMQSRLYFAVATAIKPEILIIDEVLGAGDAYFSAKSADRMKKLTGSGCTLILVSHSTQHILQFCDKAVWLESGEIVMEDRAIEVVKAYESFSKKLEIESSAQAELANDTAPSVIQSKWLREKILSSVLEQHGVSDDAFSARSSNSLISREASVSRWPAQVEGLKIETLVLKNAQNQSVKQINADEALSIDITVIAEKTGCYDLYFVVLLFTEDGRWLSRHCSNKFKVELNEGETYTVFMKYDQVLLGNGKYIFSAAIYKVLDLDDLSTARYYDLLSRSFEFQVSGIRKQDLSLFLHPVRWMAQGEQMPGDLKSRQVVEIQN